MKKGNNEGSIRLRKDGRWEGRISLGFNIDGSRKRRSIICKTRAEVREKMIVAMKELQDGDFNEPSYISVAAWIENWLNNYIKLKIRKSTWESYESMYRTHIKDEIGSIKLIKLTTSNLQQLYNKLLLKPCNQRGDTIVTKTLSPRTVRYCNQVIHGALEQAVKENILKKNVSKNCILPKDNKKEMKTLDIEQVKIFLEYTKSHRLYASFLLDLTTGLRRGELLGLRWSDIDFETNTISLEQQIICTRTGDEFTNLKTDLSRRTIDVPKHVINELNAHRLRQEVEEKWIVKKSWKQTGLVFVNEIGGHINPKNYYRTFKLILNKLGLPNIRFHDLRHTYAMICMQEGVNIKALQENLGHHSPAFTLEIYGHASIQMKKEAAEKIGNIIKKCTSGE